MITSLLVVALGQSKDIQALTAQSLAAHKAMASFHATIDVEEKSKNVYRKLNFDLQVIRPGKIRLGVKRFSSSGGLELNRLYILDGGMAYGRDLVTSQWFKRAVDAKYPLADKLASTYGAMPDGLRMLVDQQMMASTYSVLPKLINVTITKGGATIVKSATKTGTTIFGFDSAHRLNQMKATGPKTLSSFRVSYLGGSSSIAIPSASTGAQVTDLGEPSSQPRYANATSRAIAQRLFQRYAKISSAAYSSVDGFGASQVWYMGDKVRFKSKDWEWSNVGNVITIVNYPSRKYWQAKSDILNSLYRLSIAKAPTEPIIRSILAGKHPLQGFYSSKYAFKFVGSFGSGKTNYDVLETTQAATGVKTTFEISHDSALIKSTRTKISGSTYETKLAYSAVNTELPASAFAIKIPAGFTKTPFKTQ